MEKLIVWFIPKDKKTNTFNQIHVLSDSVENAIKLCNENLNFEHKIIGVGKYRDIKNNEFINLKLY